MKPSNAVEYANKKLKQNAQTQDAYGIQAMSVLYTKQLEAISQQTYVLWEGGRAPSARSPTFPLWVQAGDM